MEWRSVANTAPTQLLPGEKPGAIENEGGNGHIWAIRDFANLQNLDAGLVNAVQFLKEALENPAKFQPQDLQRPSLAPLLAQDGANAPHLFGLVNAASEALDLHGKPLRWQLAPNLAGAYSIPRIWKISKPIEEPRIPRLTASARSDYYRELVHNFAQRYGLSPELVMAIIHSESDFSPGLVSNKSAMGLMQLLPSTASGEVHRFLYGRNGDIGFEDLRVPEINIKYGTAYLHILFNRYFANVKNREIRENCAIASYNLGPNRFLRLYGQTPDLAVEQINSMTLEEFLADLPGRLPARETRFFVEKVKRMKNHYASMQ